MTGPSAADYTLPSDFDVHNPKHEKEFIFKGDVTFGKASRMDTFSYLRKCPGADRDIPGPESYRPKTVGQFEVPVKQKVFLLLLRFPLKLRLANVWFALTGRGGEVGPSVLTESKDPHFTPRPRRTI